VGVPLRFGPLDHESAITERLHAAVSRLIEQSGGAPQ